MSIEEAEKVSKLTQDRSKALAMIETIGNAKEPMEIIKALNVILPNLNDPNLFRSVRDKLRNYLANVVLESEKEIKAIGN